METPNPNCGQRLDSALTEVILDPDKILLPQQLEQIPRACLTESYRRLQLLYELSRQICAETDVNNVFAAVLHALQHLFVAERCFVVTPNGETGFHACSTQGDIVDDPTEEWPLSRTIVRRVYREGVAVLSPNALADFPGAPSVGRHSIRSVICAPLGPQNSRLGVLYADNTAAVNKFSELDLSFLTLLGHYAYLAVCNAKRLQEAQVQQQLSAQRCTVLQSELLREHNIVGSSKELLTAFELLQRAARSDLPILLLGESGTGKDVFARAAHRISKRSNEFFMPVHMAAEPEELVESALFGHEAEAFTGATRRKPGKFELANKGTLFLDEVGEMSLSVQAKLLRVLENHSFERVGGTQSIHVDFRLICATNKDLAAEAAAGRFREDLYFRINGISITLPPLRQRSEDIPGLVMHFLSQLGAKKTFEKAALALLSEYSWPGNIRELAHVIERAVVMCQGPTITAIELQNWLGTTSTASKAPLPSLGDIVAQAEREHIRRALRIARGNKEQAARILGIAKGTLYGKMEKYSLEESADET